MGRKSHTAVEICGHLAQASGESLNQTYPSNEPHTGQALPTSSPLLSSVIGEEQPKGRVDRYDSKAKDVVAGYCQSIIFPAVGPLRNIGPPDTGNLMTFPLKTCCFIWVSLSSER